MNQVKNTNIGSITNSIVNIESAMEHVNQNIASADSINEATRQQL